MTVVFDPGSSAGAVVGGAIIGAGVGVGPTNPCVTVDPIFEPAYCTVEIKPPLPLPSKSLDSSCLRSSQNTDVPSYSNVTVIIYLKVFSLKVTAVIVTVMLFTLELGRAL